MSWEELDKKFEPNPAEPFAHLKALSEYMRKMCEEWDLKQKRKEDADGYEFMQPPDWR